jgi:hypothetical protein
LAKAVRTVYLRNAVLFQYNRLSWLESNGLLPKHHSVSQQTVCLVPSLGYPTSLCNSSTKPPPPQSFSSGSATPACCSYRSPFICCLSINSPVHTYGENLPTRTSRRRGAVLGMREIEREGGGKRERPGAGRKERECCLSVLNLVSSTLTCIRQPGPRLRVLDVCGFV